MRFLMSFLIGASAVAEPILFRAPGVTDLEYRARLRLSEAFRTPTEAYLAQRPSSHARDVLLTRFARAQEAFVGNSLGEAKRHFQEVVALVNIDDWSTIDREILLHAYLRLAQLESRASERQHWLDQTPFLGPHLKVQTDLFPPPLIAGYRALLRAGERLTLDPERTGWPLLLINGVPCRARDCPSFPSAEKTVRVTFVSDQWIPQTVQLDLARLRHARPARVDWVRGVCGRDELSAPARELGTGRAFFGLSCDGLAPAASSPPVEVKTAVATVSLPAAVLAPPPAKPRRPFYESKWLWIGAGVVAAGALAIAVTRSTSRHPGAGAESAGPAADADVPATVYSF